jgi:hypothetical protein
MLSRRVNVLFSKPGGPPQELHFDDKRDKGSGEVEGELLSAIVALQDNTRLDIEGDNRKRLTYSIPPTSMFLFSGNCKHGGSLYTRFNVRLHLYLWPKQSLNNNNANVENVILVNRPCPLKDCQHSKDGETFGKTELYYHWNRHHLKDVGISVGKYIRKRRGLEVFQCSFCKKGFNTKRGLGRHMKQTCRVRKSLM